jgi:hypothetical protein
MPGFKQFVTGIFLFLPLTLFGSLTSPPLYMVALAFPAYGVQGVAMGWNRIHGVDPRVGSVVVPQAFAGIACGDHGSAYAETGDFCRAKQLSGQRDLQPLEGWRRGTWSRQRKKRSLS